MFEKLEYIYTVYEEKSFSRAAEKLFISQPSLSTAIRKEEERLGAPLFERGSGGIKLTEIGEEYIRAARQVKNIDENFRKRIEDISNVETGKIVIGGTNYLSSYILPRIVNCFSTLHPHIEVTLVEENSMKLSRMLENEEVDIMIDSFNGEMTQFCGALLSPERIYLCVPADRSLNKELKKYQVPVTRQEKENLLLRSVPTLDLSLFRDENFILLKPGNDMYLRAMTYFERYQMMPKVLFRVDQMNTSYAMAASGMGLCFVTDTLLRFRRSHENIVLYDAGQEGIDRNLHVVYKKTDTAPRPCRSLSA